MEQAEWTPQIWDDEEFLASVRTWASASVGRVHAMVRLERRPWAAVWKLTSETGEYFLKQNCPAGQYEARVVSILARVDPQHVVVPVAVDPDRDLLLSADMGPTFRRARGDPTLWTLLVREAMELARASVPVVAELGLAELRPEDTAGYVSRAMAAWSFPEERGTAIRRAGEQAARDGEELAALGLPMTLNHNDLHDQNAFLDGDHVRFFDFGDAIVSSPLMALRIPLNVFARSLTEGVDHQVRRLADDALEVWSDYAPMSQLRAALPAALRLGALGRAEAWHRLLVEVSRRHVDERFLGADVFWLAEAGADLDFLKGRVV